jgi:large subunit ribosomal protein L22
MPHWRYSVKELDPDRSVKCSGRELSISPKASRELCLSIKGLKLEDAKKFLEAVIDRKLPVPLRRYNKEVGHRRMPYKGYAGRYPVKAAKTLLRLLEELESNAEYKGLDIENLKIIHAAAQRGRKIKRYTPRAFGRSSPKFDTLTHIELVGYEAI